MRILVLSDLHLDFPGSWSLPADLPDHDVVVLAGDIHRSPADAIRWADANFSKPVVYIPGNHDFWGGRIDDRNFDGGVAAMGTRVRYIPRDSVVIDGVTFVGATLWTDYALSGDQKWAMHRAWSDMNDHRRIRKSGGRFVPHDALMQHRADLDHIVLSLADVDVPTVVVTHHAPHPNSLDQVGVSDLNPAYASDLSKVIEDCKPSLWVHGHVHVSNDYVVGSTRIVSNPKGYGGGSDKGWAKAENAAFDMKIVEV